MLSLYLALAAILAQLINVQAYDYSTARLCTTKYGAKSTAVKTSSYALTIPLTITKKFTTTPTSSITPPPQTTTSTTTTTTTAIVVTTPTNTYTETAYSTSTFTTTTFFTTGTITTATTTSSVATYTSPTPSGFTPLASEVGYVPKKRFIDSDAASAPAIRGRRVEERAASKSPVCPPVGKPGSFSQYPQAVTCGALVVAKTTITKTYTASSTATTTLPASTSTVTSTATTTETSISIAAPASTTTTTTLGVSTTTTASSTVTTTDTVTATIIQASATVYAACSPNNIVNHANGNQGISTAFATGDGSTITSEVAISDPRACCEQCQKSSGCTGYAQYPGLASCYIFSNGQCDAANNKAQYFVTNSGIRPEGGYTVGNGNCGQIGNGGSQG